MTWWNRFKKWMWWKTCPRMTIFVCCGKEKDGRFATTKQFVFKEKPENRIFLYCEYKFDKDYEITFGGKVFTREEILVIIDEVTSAETIEETMKRMDEENGGG